MGAISEIDAEIDRRLEEKIRDHLRSEHFVPDRDFTAVYVRDLLRKLDLKDALIEALESKLEARGDLATEIERLERLHLTITEQLSHARERKLQFFDEILHDSDSGIRITSTRSGFDRGGLGGKRREVVIEFGDADGEHAINAPTLREALDELLKIRG